MPLEPLAYRMRPTSLEEIVGNAGAIGPGTPLFQMIANGHVPSMLLYGAPGVGKTSLAYAIAGESDLPFFALNATTSGKKDIEVVFAEAKLTGRVLLFLDEIHRFNKLQQDALLPHIESGSVALIGATTENPYHDVNPAIRSRCGQILQLERLAKGDLLALLQKALRDPRGYGERRISVAQEQLERIAAGADGDARRALTLLESAVEASDEREGETVVEDALLDALIGRIGAFGDKKGTHFYNLLSALQKSVRGSDVDAALFYAAHLLEVGDLTALSRRLLVMAYEDVGLANADVPPQVLAAVEAAERLGLPEGRIPLANAIALMCLSEKSNSAYAAMDRALGAVRSGAPAEIPLHLRDAHYEGAAALGHKGYRYPHDSPIGSFGGWNDQRYLPASLEGVSFYKPVAAGDERKLAAIFERLKSFRT